MAPVEVGEGIRAYNDFRDAFTGAAGTGPLVGGSCPPVAFALDSSDLVQDGDELGTDCGGTVCRRCP